MKAQIKADYIARVEATYEWAKPGSPMREKGLTKMSEAADMALAGKIRLEGDCWFEALRAAGVKNPKTATRKEIASLPE